MKTLQKGFTLIELLVVIIILGVVAAVAIPKYQDAAGLGTQNAVDYMAGVFGAAVANNALMKKVGSAGIDLSGVEDCAALGGILLQTDPVGYTPSGDLDNGLGPCTITKDGKSASFESYNTLPD